jgi:subtilisin family serine protease
MLLIVTPAVAQKGTSMIFGELFDNAGDLSSFLGNDPNKLSYIYLDHLLPLRLADGQSTKVGLIDSGINPDHPQLRGLIAAMRSFTAAAPEDSLGHGTSVAITAMAGGSSGALYSAKVTDDQHRPELDATIAALTWLTEQNVALINMSLGFDASRPGAERLCSKLAEIETLPNAPLIVVAAGNRGPDWKSVPAACGAANVMVVASDEATSGAGDVAAPRPVSMSRTAYDLAQASGLFGIGDFFGAIILAAQVTGREPANASAWHILAAASFQIGQTPRALAFAEKAIEADPDLAQALWLHALAAANLDQRGVAIGSLDRLLALASDYPEAGRLRSFLADETHALPSSLAEFFTSR